MCGVTKLAGWDWKSRLLQFLNGQRGFTLIEGLVAASILAAIGVVLMNAMFTGGTSVGIMDEKQQAEVLIRSQIENIKYAPYLDSGEYPVTVDVPAQYSLTITVTAPTCIGEEGDCTSLEELMGGPVTTIQEIKVAVFHGNQPVLSVACYKVKQ